MLIVPWSKPALIQSGPQPEDWTLPVMIAPGIQVLYANSSLCTPCMEPNICKKEEKMVNFEWRKTKYSNLKTYHTDLLLYIRVPLLWPHLSSFIPLFPLPLFFCNWSCFFSFLCSIYLCHVPRFSLSFWCCLFIALSLPCPFSFLPLPVIPLVSQSQTCSLIHTPTNACATAVWWFICLQLSLVKTPLR